MRAALALLVLLSASTFALGSKYAPADGRILVFAGQSPRATRDYWSLANTPRAAGFSDYISYKVGQPYCDTAPDAPRRFRGNDGLLVATNWGSGDQCVACLLEQPGFEHSLVNIGLDASGPPDPDGTPCRGRAGCGS